MYDNINVLYIYIREAIIENGRSECREKKRGGKLENRTNSFFEMIARTCTANKFLLP